MLRLRQTVAEKFDATTMAKKTPEKVMAYRTLSTNQAGPLSGVASCGLQQHPLRFVLHFRRPVRHSIFYSLYPKI
uniref:Uncharacterized protein n=1 Tax=Arundo donax TaxID=35708 RepID=A0A0A8XZ02_ARUDO